MVRIGITSRLLLDPERGWVSTLAATYLQAIEAAGAMPIIIPVFETPSAEVLRELLSTLQGIVFSGGEDVDPTHYGEQPHAKLGDISAARDATEIPLARLAFESDIPILGICRGQQLLNVALGGTLFQDISSQIAKALNHRLELATAQADLAKTTHAVKMEGALGKILGANEMLTNSHHHQAVKNTAPPLRANAWASDGIIEGLEAPLRKAFFLAVQGHPERVFDKPLPGWKRLFEAFIQACQA